jgi:predicted RNase H-like HicB family nuclease
MSILISGGQTNMVLSTDRRILTYVGQPTEYHMSKEIELDDGAHRSLVPDQLIGRYVNVAVHRAVYERLDDGRWYAEIPILPGVWADGDSEMETLVALREVVEGWVEFKIEDHDEDIPVIDTIDLNLL